LILLTADLDALPATVMNIGHKLLYRPEPKDGPVLVTIEFQFDRSRGSKFVDLMREVRLIHLRNGAYSWQLFEDPSRLNTFRIEMMVPSWTQYMLQQQPNRQMTNARRRGRFPNFGIGLKAETHTAANCIRVVAIAARLTLVTGIE
jgi:hypothetical protein